MKLKLKAMIAAVTMAAAGQAAAALPNGDMLLYVWDSNGSAATPAPSSFLIDLGPAANFTASGTTTLTFSVASDANYSAFTGQSSFAADLSGGFVKWGLLDAVSTTEFISTLASGGTFAAPSAGNTTSIRTNINTLTNAATGTTSDFSSSGVSDWGSSAKSNLFNLVSFNADNLIGASGVKIADILTPSGRGAVPTITTFARTAAFDGSTLTLSSVAAVPEPGTWAMLVAGLMMVGGIARRRTS